VWNRRLVDLFLVRLEGGHARTRCSSFYVKGVYKKHDGGELGGRQGKASLARKRCRKVLSLTMTAEPLIGRLGRHSRACKAFFALRVGLPPFSGCDRFRAALERFHLSGYPLAPRPRLRTHEELSRRSWGKIQAGRGRRLLTIQ